MKRLKALGRLLLALARELSDENAYHRHLAAHGLVDSGEEYRKFSEHYLRAKYMRAKCCGLALAALLLSAAPRLAAAGPEPLPSLRERDAIERQWLSTRLDQVLPELMRKHGIDMWLVVCREHNEDPVFFSLTAPTSFTARRRTILLFFDRPGQAGLERLTLGGGSQGGLYRVYRDPESPDRELGGQAQWNLLRKLVAERNPRRIGINMSETDAFADGLSATERDLLEAALGPEYMRRVVHAEGLAIEYLEVRLPEMLPVYTNLMATAHELMRRALSREVITPGKTTTDDVVWWLRERTAELKASVWFQPDLHVQRRQKSGVSFVADDAAVVIQPGDVLHLDFGLSALHLHTDTQQMAYVPRQGEHEAPAELRRTLAQALRLQEIVRERLKPGRTGNQVLAEARAAMKPEGIEGSVYSHPVGDHGHAAGPIIGLWDRQHGVPGRGDAKLIPSSWFSVELAVRSSINAWDGKEIFIGLEEEAVLDRDGRTAWVVPPPHNFHLVQ
ncbi:MAG: M24 family metallopeptidase [Acidobacteriales bacterium]|nr:M24 family metallopeptidase [Terriglobales bacterium]